MKLLRPFIALGIGCVLSAATLSLSAQSLPPLYHIDTPLQSRSISFENPTGAKGAGGRASSKLGVGRKGLPAKEFPPGHTFTLCNIEGPGVIRHIWCTISPSIETLQGIVFRAYWDDQKHPAIEAPLGACFGMLHGWVSPYQSAAHAVNSNAGMNLWLEMPFASRARITVTNESPKTTPLFYNIDSTLGDTLPPTFGRLHILYRRENPTTLKRDFEILPRRSAAGCFLGCLLGVRPLGPYWWGEGEVKFYLDGDADFPTICGTGTEDYIGQSWGLQQTPYRYGGTCFHDKEKGLYTIYRWHLKDPVYFKSDIRVTIQQIGYLDGLYERQDDWSAAAFWYEPVPSAPLPPLPKYADRVKDYLPTEKKK